LIELLKARCQEDEAVFIPIQNIGNISVIKEEGTGVEPQFSILYFDKRGQVITKKEGFASFSQAVTAVERAGLVITIE